MKVGLIDRQEHDRWGFVSDKKAPCAGLLVWIFGTQHRHYL